MSIRGYDEDTRVFLSSHATSAPVSAPGTSGAPKTPVIRQRQNFRDRIFDLSVNHIQDTSSHYITPRIVRIHYLAIYIYGITSIGGNCIAERFRRSLPSFISAVSEV